MEKSFTSKNCHPDAIIQFAKRNYKTYLAHYKARNLQPMPFNEFVKNYSN